MREGAAFEVATSLSKYAQCYSLQLTRLKGQNYMTYDSNPELSLKMTVSTPFAGAWMATLKMSAWQILLAEALAEY